MEEIKKGKKKQKKQRKIEGKKKLKQALPHSEWTSAGRPPEML